LIGAIASAQTLKTLLLKKIKNKSCFFFFSFLITKPLLTYKAFSQETQPKAATNWICL
jgi:hypothetical protein